MPKSLLTPAGVCRQTALIMVWFDLVLSCAKESTYSCRCVQTDSFNHGLVWFCPVMKSPLTPAGVCRQTDLIMVWLVLSCAEGPTNTCRCVCTDRHFIMVWLVLSCVEKSTYISVTCRCVCTDRHFIMVWLVLSCAEEPTYSCWCMQTGRFNHGLVLSCAEEPTCSCWCMQTGRFNHGLVLSCAE